MANYNHTNGLFRKRRLQEAVAYYRRALDARPQIEEARLNLANALSRLGRFEEAAEEYEACLKLNPQNGKTYFNLGNAYFQLGQLHKAIERYQNVSSGLKVSHGRQLPARSGGAGESVIWRASARSVSAKPRR